MELVSVANGFSAGAAAFGLTPATVVVLVAFHALRAYQNFSWNTMGTFGLSLTLAVSMAFVSPYIILAAQICLAYITGTNTNTNTNTVTGTGTGTGADTADVPLNASITLLIEEYCNATGNPQPSNLGKKLKYLAEIGIIPSEPQSSEKLRDMLLIENTPICRNLNRVVKLLGEKVAGELALMESQQCKGGVCLNLSGLSKLFDLPEWIQDIENLQILNLAFTSLKTLPDWIKNLTHLEMLRVTGTPLETLPDEIGKLKELKALNLALTSLKTLPSEIKKLTNLGKLILNCTHLEALPYDIGELKKLQALYLRNCANLTTLPESMQKLKELKTLDLRNCTNLTTLPESMQKLKELKILFSN